MRNLIYLVFFLASCDISNEHTLPVSSWGDSLGLQMSIDTSSGREGYINIELYNGSSQPHWVVPVLVLTYPDTVFHSDGYVELEIWDSLGNLNTEWKAHPANIDEFFPPEIVKLMPDSVVSGHEDWQSTYRIITPGLYRIRGAYVGRHGTHPDSLTTDRIFSNWIEVEVGEWPRFP